MGLSAQAMIALPAASIASRGFSRFAAARDNLNRAEHAVGGTPARLDPKPRNLVEETYPGEHGIAVGVDRDFVVARVRSGNLEARPEAGRHGGWRNDRAERQRQQRGDSYAREHAPLPVNARMRRRPESSLTAGLAGGVIQTNDARQNPRVWARTPIGWFYERGLVNVALL
jgi:hypothetical protein